MSQPVKGAAVEEQLQSKSSKNLLPLRAMQDNHEKAMAVILTHISNSHAMLVEHLELYKHGTALPSSAQTGSLRGSDPTMNGKTGQKLDLHTLVTQQDLDSNQELCSSVPQRMPNSPTALLPYQQELTDRVKNTDNSIVFLPSGECHGHEYLPT